jgi:zinc transport system substrate-binding protein
MSRFVFLSGLLLLIGAGVGNGGEVALQVGKKLQVYASFFPLYDLTRKIGGDRVEVYNLTPAGTEPHEWEPTPRDLINLHKADLFVYNGEGLEHWVTRILPTLENGALKAFAMTQGIELRRTDSSQYPSGENREGGGVDHPFDPHVWLSPLLARMIIANIATALRKVDAAGTDYYNGNLLRYDAELRSLDKEYRARLDGFAGKDLVVAHAAFAYLCADYGLRQVAIAGLSPEDEPDPRTLAGIIDYARERGVKVIFFESAANPRLAETLAREIGATVGVLNPLETLSSDAVAAGEDYFSVMRENLAAIQAALE